jgi:cytoplasmic iron level regulating protein YaaA (DUF328/UPF0246 family)
MATKKVFHDTKIIAPQPKLANWWQPAVTKHLSKDLVSKKENTTPILVNLASDEYAAAVDPSELPEGTQFIKIVFWEQGRTIAVHAKRARGLMVRYLAEHDVTNVQGIQKFDVEGYSFVSSQSNDTKLVFDRTKQTKTTPKSSTQPSKKKTKKTPAAAATGKTKEAKPRAAKRTRSK